MSDFEESRLAFFSAIGANDIEKVRFLRAQSPALIHTTTKTDRNSSLQIAVERGLEPICKLLINGGHETNPVNDKGETPYQWSKIKEPISQLLLTSHSQALFKNFPRFHNPDNVLLHDSEEFEAFSNELERKVGGLFARSILCKNESENMLKTRTSFKKEILMIPHFGPLCVYRENSRLELLIEAGQTNDGKIRIGKEFVFLVKFVEKGFESYPFLNEGLKVTDRPDIAKAKKLFLVYGMIMLEKFIHSNPPVMCLLPQYNVQRSAANRVMETYDTENMEAIYYEITDDYGWLPQYTIQLDHEKRTPQK